MYREFFCLTVQGELETIREERLKHHVEIVVRHGCDCLGGDVKSFRIQPVGARDLIVEHVPGPSNRAAESDVTEDEAVRRRLDCRTRAFFAAAGCGSADGRYFEGWLRKGRARH